MTELDPSLSTNATGIDQQGPQATDKDLALTGALQSVESLMGEYESQQPTNRVLGVTESGSFVSVIQLGEVENSGEDPSFIVQFGSLATGEDLTRSDVPYGTGLIPGQPCSAFQRDGGSGGIFPNGTAENNIEFPSGREKSQGKKITFNGEDVIELSELSEMMNSAAQQELVAEEVSVDVKAIDVVESAQSAEPLVDKKRRRVGRPLGKIMLGRR